MENMSEADYCHVRVTRPGFQSTPVLWLKKIALYTAPPMPPPPKYLGLVAFDMVIEEAPPEILTLPVLSCGPLVCKASAAS